MAQCLTALRALAEDQDSVPSFHVDPDNTTPGNPMLSSDVHEYQALYGIHIHTHTHSQNTQRIK